MSANSPHQNPPRLGPLVVVYQDRPFLWRDLFLLFIPATLAVLVPVLYGFMRNFYARTHYGPLVALHWSQPWYLLAAAASIPLLLLALRRVRRAHRRVHLHQNGLRVTWTGGRHTAFLWPDLHGLSHVMIENKFLGLNLGTQQQLILFPRESPPLRIDDHIRKLPDLIARLKAQFYPDKLDELRRAFRQGETLSFGAVSVHQGGIRLRGKWLPWEQVTTLNLVRGRLVVESTLMRRVKLPIHKIPNLELLIQLLQEGVIP